MSSEEGIPVWVKLLEEIALEAKTRRRKRLGKIVRKV
jgi:hypothetical protein